MGVVVEVDEAVVDAGVRLARAVEGWVGEMYLSLFLSLAWETSKRSVSIFR